MTKDNLELAIDLCIVGNKFDIKQFNKYESSIIKLIKKNNSSVVFEDLQLTNLLDDYLKDKDVKPIKDYIDDKLANKPEQQTSEGSIVDPPEVGKCVKVFNPNRNIWEAAKLIGYDKDTNLYIFKSLSLAGTFNVSGSELKWQIAKRYQDVDLVSKQVRVK